MKEYHGHPLFKEFTEQELELHSAKNRDYAQGGNPLGNFYRVSAIKSLYPGLHWDSPVGVALGYLLKQLDAAFWMLAQGYEGKVENIDTRLTDVHVYAKLARILWREQADHALGGSRGVID
jgi:hypothetical protein